MRIQADIGVGLELEMGIFAVTNQVPPGLSPYLEEAY